MKLKKIVLKTFSGAVDDDILIFAGYAAYTSLLAFFSFIIFIMAAASLIGKAEASQMLINSAFSYIPPRIVDTVTPVINNILANRSSGLFTLGGLGTLWISSSGIEGLRIGLNRVYAIQEMRPLWKRRLQSIVVVICSAITFVVLAVMVIIWPLLTDFISKYISLSMNWFKLINILRFPLAFILLAVIFSIMYRILPNHNKNWRKVSAGAIFATILWLALAQLFSVYLGHFANFDLAYGSIGGVIITLVFFQYSATVVLLGAELNAVLEE
ncbi:YihY/virulence factor BrkB family protein [Dyadobacter psychrotolerans]|uniref:YihY/virulence factor BrkB family protein n=1 Tax=Dyadobacter psychrotolerans TaxID=2541721 RepID=A0A4R5E0N2_9BACT|nr:YihY/virulence factor BrkB family protein [Dyadobacter psychrotolerans]TDE18101.1 YihY/virulence factor BrkB family protein [Dyadobacter psychrotolerans]